MYSCTRQRNEPYFLSDARGQLLNPQLDLKPVPDAVYSKETRRYTSADPRLYDPIRNIRLEFEEPPVQPENIQPLKNVACQDIQVPVEYPSYEDIRLGNVSYYTTLFKTQVFPAPIYQIRSHVTASVMTDPMGSLKPYYMKEPLLQQSQILSPYTFDQDQMFFREDLMSRQSSRIDRRNFHKFHSFFDPSDHP